MNARRKFLQMTWREFDAQVGAGVSYWHTPVRDRSEIRAIEVMESALRRVAVDERKNSL